MLNIESVKIKNFLSYEDATLTMNRSEPTLVIGKNTTQPGTVSNGAGKTALFEAVLFGLFGKTTKRNGDKAVKGGGTGCVVEVLGTSNGTPFSITRYRKHPKHKNTVNFLYGGKPIERGSKKDTQDIIEEVLEIDFDVLLQTCYFSPASIKTFCSMSDSDQKGIFQALLGLDKWEAAQAKVKAHEGLVMTKRTEVATELDVLKRLKLRDLRDLSDTLNALKDVDVTRELSRRDECKDYITANEKAAEKVAKLQHALDTCRANETFYNTEIYKLDKEITNLQKLMAGNCPTCDSPIDVQKTTDSINALREKREVFTNELITAKATMAKASSKLDELRAVVNTINNYKAELKVLENLLNSKLKSKSETKRRVEKIRTNIKDTNTKIKNLRESLVTIDAKLTQLKQLSVVFSNTGAKTYLIKQVLPHLNSSLTKYSALICPNIGIKLAAQKTMTTKQIRNKFDIQVIPPEGEGYEALSSGEAKRVDLCIVFALLELIQMLGKATNFLILDEILDNLDEAGEDVAINILKSIKQDNIFLISHKNSLASRFSSVLFIEKNGTTSKIAIDD